MKQGKPYDAEIEYLQTSGKQCVDTLVPANSTNEFEVDYEVIPSTVSIDSTGIVSYRVGSTSGTSRGIWAHNNKVALNLNGYDSGWKTLNNGRHLVQLIGSALYVDGTIVASSNTDRSYDYSPETNGLLKGRRSDSANGWDGRAAVHMKLYGCKIYNQGALARDFIPVRVGEVGYLYDKVSGQLFANASTTPFILGNDIN